MPDYQNGKIYTIRYRLDESLLYVGSTTQSLHKRWYEYKRRYDNENSCSYNLKICKAMREKNDINNWYIELYELYPCNSKIELSQKEGETQRKLKPNLNVRIENRTRKEYREEHKEKIAIQKQEWYKNNPDKIKASKERNIDKKRAFDRVNGAIQVICECGCSCRKDCLSKHRKTAKHKYLMENKSST